MALPLSGVDGADTSASGLFCEASSMRRFTFSGGGAGNNSIMDFSPADDGEVGLGDDGA